MGYSEQHHYCIKILKEMADELRSTDETPRLPTYKEFKNKLPRLPIKVLFGSFENALTAAGLTVKGIPKVEKREIEISRREPKILTLDIETKPMLLWGFGLFDQNFGIEQIYEDWSVLAWAAKWKDSEEVMYDDLSQETEYTKDERIVRSIWKLLDECDVVISQNGIRFDIPKLNDRFTKYKLGRPSPFQHIDTYRIKKKLGLTSKKLAYTSEYFNERFKKLSHTAFPGFNLWKECLKGNQLAWAEMQKYNKFDVLATEELYFKTLIQWDNTINYGVYTGVQNCCPNCGGTNLEDKKFQFTKSAMFQSYQCKDCKAFCRSSENLLLKNTKKGLMK